MGTLRDDHETGCHSDGVTRVPAPMGKPPLSPLAGRPPDPRGEGAGPAGPRTRHDYASHVYIYLCP